MASRVIEDSSVLDFFDILSDYADSDSEGEIDYSSLDVTQATSECNNNIVQHTDAPEALAAKVISSDFSNHKQITFSLTSSCTDTTKRTVSTYCRRDPAVDITNTAPSQPEEPQSAVENGMFGCSCKLKCYTLFPVNELNQQKLNCVELTTKELDLVLTSKLQALTLNGNMTGACKRPTKERQRAYTTYMHNGKPVCKSFFMNIHNVGKDRMGALLKHLTENGLVPRVKKSGGRNKLALTFERCKEIYNFILNYSETHGVKLPGRVPGMLFF